MKLGKAYALMLILTCSFSDSHMAIAGSLCETNEKTLFSCKLQNSEKSVSLCLSAAQQDQVIYKYGKTKNVEMTLPSESSGKPFLCLNRFGPASTQWLQEISFPNGEIAYVLSSPQGVSVSLSIRPFKPSKHHSAIFMWCEAEQTDEPNKGGDITNTYELMQRLNFKHQKCLSAK